MLAIRLPEEIESRLGNLAKKTGRTKTFYAREAILVRAPALAQSLLLFFRQRLEPRQAFACVAIVEAQFRGAVDTCVGRWRKPRRRRSSFDEGLLVLSRCATERLRDRVSRRRMLLQSFAQRREGCFCERVGTAGAFCPRCGSLRCRPHRRLRHRDLSRRFAHGGLGLLRRDRLRRQRSPIVIVVGRMRHPAVIGISAVRIAFLRAMRRCQRAVGRAASLQSELDAERDDET